MQTSQKLPWADNIRFFATFGVIVLHASASGLYQFGKIQDINWGILLIVDSAMRCCVPLFVMLSGSLLLSKDKELFPYLKNRFWRVFVPFLFWSLVYCMVYLASIWKNVEITEIPGLLWSILSDIVSYKGIFKQQAFHFWYVYMILGLFLAVPILRKWLKQASKNEILYFLIIWGITLVFDMKLLGSGTSNFQLTFFSGYLGYFVLGYYLSINKTEEKSGLSNIIGLIIIISIGITALLTYYFTTIKGALDEEFFRYLSPNIVILSVAVFIWFKKIKTQPKILTKWIVIINQYSFGIYLVHIIILRILKNLGISWEYVHPLVGIPLTSIICFGVSFGVIYLIRKIPGGQYISG